jgi:Chemotaxis protein; stimulates methylation of MCP proteins
MDLPYSTDDLPTAFEDGYTSDQRVRRVKIGEYEVTDSGERLVAYGLGSCLGVALFDEKESIAGLIHIKRPTAPTGTTSPKSTFADTGIRVLFDEMQSKGGTARHTKATLVGGVDTDGAASAVNMSIGRKNIHQARQTLDALGITVTNTAVGGDEAMSIHFDGGSGEATIETDSSK